MNTQFRNYCFTLNNYTDNQYKLLTENLPTVSKYAIIGKEHTDDEEKTPHLQGYVQLIKRERFNKIKEWFKACADGSIPHIEKSKGSANQNRMYCSKECKFWEHGQIRGQGQRMDIEEFFRAIENGATDYELIKGHPVEFAKYGKAAHEARQVMHTKAAKDKLVDKFKNSEFRPWQQMVVDHLKEQDDRTITWVYDILGNAGKSWLAKWLVQAGSTMLVRGGKTVDLAYAYDYQETVVFDFTRQQESTVNYGIIESFKDGYLFSAKYQSCEKWFEPCRVLCLSNWRPDLKMLSEDRWDIINLNDDLETGAKESIENTDVNVTTCSHNNCNEIQCLCECHNN